MEWVCKKINQIIDYVIGWVEIIKYQEMNYKYIIDGIETKSYNDQFYTYVRYKILGCRTLINEPVKNLNNSHLFSLFRPDHAQIIVSIATLEALVNKPSPEIIDRYVRYVDQCSLKIKERKR